MYVNGLALGSHVEIAFPAGLRRINASATTLAIFISTPLFELSPIICLRQ
jgi:hypothetical protein